MNPDRNVQLSVTLIGELTSIISPIRRSLFVSAWGKHRAGLCTELFYAILPYLVSLHFADLL